MILLITNRKSYAGCRLPPNSMTLKAKTGIFMDFGPRHTFQERIVPKSNEINIEKLH